MTALVAGCVTVCLVAAAAGRSPAARVPGRPSPAALPARQRITTTGTALLDRAWPGRRGRRRDAQLPDALDRLASSLRAGRSIGPALEELARATSSPLGDDLRVVGAALEHGGTVAAALRSWSTRPGSSGDVRLVTAALTLGADAGGQVARAVDRVAATLRERHELAGEVRALAVQARSSAAVLAVAPLAFAVLVAAIQPGAVAFLVTKPVGAVCLVLGVGLEATGVAWMARITRSAA